MNGHNGALQNGSSKEQPCKSLEEECDDLRSKLLSLQRKRRQIRKLADEDACEKVNHWLIQKQMAERERQVALANYQATVTSLNCQARWLDLAEKWNVTNDCFHIWHRGPFGTINGLRLASEVPSLPSGSVVDDADACKPSETASSTNNGQPSLIGSLSMAVDSQGGQSISQQPPENLKIPWVEINSALGLTVLLLATLEKKPYSGIKYHNKLVPQGSTSKIGIRKGESVTFYGLYSDDSFQIFGKRSFNIALNGLIRCLADAGETVEKVDRTIFLPHAVETVAGGLYTIGGLSVAYGTDAEQWTRAMKYMLTDVKWLVAFATKHVDR